MNQKDIIRMAREAGAVLSTAPMFEGWRFIDDERLERFFRAAYAAGRADLANQISAIDKKLDDAIRARGQQ